MPTILRGDARSLPLPDSSVDLIVTSPPYFGLRSYQDGGEHYDGQVGSEPTPAEFIAALIECTREMVRVLKPSGSIFLNLGDKYAGAPSGPRTPMGDGYTRDHEQDQFQTRRRVRHNVPTKSLMLIPERYRIACVDELGLIARAVLVWSKPNGLPESVTDRVRRSHEDWVHLTKEPRYFSAVDEIREPHSPESIRLQRQARERPRKADRHHEVGHYKPGDATGFGTGARELSPLGKLPGSVWEIATQPLKVPAELGIDHFAAFPMEWPRRLIQGWSPREVCTACGEGRRPVVHKPSPLGHVRESARDRITTPRSRLGQTSTIALSGGARQKWEAENPPVLTGYACACPDTSAPSTPGVVLDPFGGTGTTALVAAMLGRRGISVDLSADYCRLAQWRASDPKQRARAAGMSSKEVSKLRPTKTPDQSSIFDEVDKGAA